MASCEATAAVDDRETCKTTKGNAAIEACTRAIAMTKYKSKKQKRVPSLLYTNRGVDYEVKKEYDKAIADHDRSGSNRETGVSNNRGNAYTGKQDYTRAIAGYEEAIKLNPKYVEALYNRGLARRNNGNWAGGEANIKRAQALQPGIGNVKS